MREKPDLYSRHQNNYERTTDLKGMELYSWQKKCLALWEKHDHRGIVNVVTGAGKTAFSLAAADKLLKIRPDLRIKVVVPTIPLAEQWMNALLHHFSDYRFQPALFGGGARCSAGESVIVYIINSARDHLSSHVKRELSLDHPVLLICDECHHYQSPKNRRIFDFMTEGHDLKDRYFSLGLSATPFGTDNDGILIKSLGDEIMHYSFTEAARDDIITPFCIGEISASFLPDELEKYSELSDRISVLLKKLFRIYPVLKEIHGKDFIRFIKKKASSVDMDPSDPAALFLLLTYQRKELSNLAFSRIKCCISLIGKLRKHDRILVFCERISQAEELVRLIRWQFGNVCSLYHSGQTKTARKRIMDSFRLLETRILVSCRCLDEGMDVPDVNIGIVLSSSSIDRQRIQRMGRILRKSTGKAAATLYYIFIRESSDNPSYLSGFDDERCFSLRYYSNEDMFSNPIYEYCSSHLLSSVTLDGDYLRELRSCLNEGLVRSDYLLPADEIMMNIKNAGSTHEKNYWKTMKAVHFSASK